MRKKSFLYSLATLLTGAVATSSLTACTEVDSTIDNAQQLVREAPVYHVSIPATIGGEAQTRAVSLASDGALDATFRTTDNIFVYFFDTYLQHNLCSARDNENTPIYLHANANAATATLVPEKPLTFKNQYNESVPLSLDNNLLLVYNSDSYIISYTGQTGTLTGLNAYDYAEAEVEITNISGDQSNGYTVTTKNASFNNEQSMYKFTFTDLPSGVGVASVTIHSKGGKLQQCYNYETGYSDDGDITITLDNAARTANGQGVVYAALRFNDFSSSETDEITFTVTGTNGKTYTKQKTSPTGGFKNGNYYSSTISLKLPTNLSQISGTSFEAKNNDVLTGSLNSSSTRKIKITIADGATITLDNATIDGINNNDCKWAGITCNGNATIILKGSNTVKGFYYTFPGIYVPSGKTLTILGDGSLDVSSQNGTQASGAAIGAGATRACGNIVIKGGDITATGYKAAAAIGGAYLAPCGDITIYKTITKIVANRGVTSPNCIGAGADSSCGTITYEEGLTVSQSAGKLTITP